VHLELPLSAALTHELALDRGWNAELLGLSVLGVDDRGRTVVAVKDPQDLKAALRGLLNSSTPLHPKVLAGAQRTLKRVNGYLKDQPILRGHRTH
jgi:hypothetical protein